MSAIANTIKAQLGGQKFVAMTGAKNFSTSGNDLTFTLWRTAKKIKHVKIILNANDLYDVKFYNSNADAIIELSDVFATDLQTVFTRHTGLDTHL
jgi:hypothetical protein